MQRFQPLGIVDFELEGLYVFPTRLARELAPAIRAETFFFSFELIHRAQQRGATIASATMRYLPRVEGRSKVANLARIRRVAAEVERYARARR